MGRGNHGSARHRGQGRHGNSWARQWVHLSDERADLRVMSYNILSEVLQQDNNYLYPCCPKSVLEWGNRFRAIRKEIETHQPDVLCLQEVDTRQQAAMQEALNSLGLEGFFCSRTGTKPDSAGLFWRTQRLTCLAREHIKMRDHGLNDNAAQVACLRLSGRPTAPTIIIGNIHVLFNQKRGDVKLGQVRTLLDTMHRVGCALGSSVGIACGDFNSCAGSPLYRFCVEGSLDLRPYAKGDISGSLSDRHGGYGGNRGSMHYNGGMHYRGGYKGNHAHMPHNHGHHNAHAHAQHSHQPPHNMHAHMGGQRGGMLRPHQYGHQQRPPHANQQPPQHMHAPTGIRGPPARRPAHWAPISHPSGSFQNPPAMNQQHGVPDWASAESIPGHSEGMLPEHSSGRMPEGRGGYRGRQGGPVPRSGGRHHGRAQYVYGRHGRHMVGRGTGGNGSGDGQNLERFRGAGDAGFDGAECNWSQEALLAAFGREPDSPVLQHPLSLQSAYTSVLGQEPPFTTCHSQGKKTVDFVWYTADAFSSPGDAPAAAGGLRPVAVLQAPHPQAIARGLPTTELPSDHISLVADFVVLGGEPPAATEVPQNDEPILVE